VKALLPMCVGGVGAAVILSLLYYRLPSPRLAIGINCVGCALLAAVTGYPHPHPVVTPLVAGFLSTATPLTSVFQRRPAIETLSDAIRFAVRIGGLLALNLLYGAAFAMVGLLSLFLVASPPY
jgi:hypothetical protein